MQPAVSCGIDIGHSGVKIVARTRRIDGTVAIHRVFFPTAVMEAFDIRDQSERELAAKDTVKIGNRRYFVGETALLHGEPETFLDDDWVKRAEHAALLRVAANRVEDLVGHGFGARVMVLGLPARLESLQREALGAIAADLCPGWEIVIVPQSKAPFYSHLFDDRGRSDPAAQVMQKGWGIIDVGRYTTDCAAIIQGRWTEASFSSDVGTKFAEDHLIWVLGRDGHELSQTGAEEALRTGLTIRNTRQIDLGAQVDEAVANLRKKVLEYARRNFAKVGLKLNGIILAGGGAVLVQDAIRGNWETVVTLPESRFAIADGMSKFGLAVESARGVAPARSIAVTA